MAKQEAVEQAVEQVAEAAEFVSEEADRAADTVRSLTGREMSFGFIGVCIGVAVGGFAGYRFASKRLETKFDKIASDEIEQMRDHYLKKEAAKQEQATKPNLSEKVEALGYATKDTPPTVVRQGDFGPVGPGPAAAVVVPEMPQSVLDEEAVAVRANVFEEHVWNHEVEVVSRTAEEPYVIHKDEFDQGNFQGEPHEKATVTYFVEDDVLVDESDAQLRGVDELIGLENLERFGHGSGDANIVYVRNHQVNTDFEVQRSMGSYASEVHGVSEEEDLEHSAMRRHRSRRRDDED